MAGDIFKGQLDAIVLAVVAAQPSHGYAVIEEIRRLSGGLFDFPEGTIYPVLHRLEADRLLASAWDDGAGRRRRVYSLTRKGGDRLAAHRSGWTDFARAMDGILGKAPWPA